MKTKIYPRVSMDTAIKFIFDDEWRHYTMRLAGQPLLLTEQFYKDLWWTAFLENYYKYLENNLQDEEECNRLSEAIRLTKLFINSLVAIGDRWRSPFVVYADDYIN